MIQVLIYNAIVTSPTVIAIAGSRVYPMRLPRDAALPALVYRVSSIQPVTSINGDSGIDNVTVEVVAWAKEYSTAHELAYAARKALIGESGLRLVTESQDDEEDLDTHSYAVISRFNIWSAFNIGAAPLAAMNPVLAIGYYPFNGDGVSTKFAIPKFRANSLVLFINGRVATKGTGGEYLEEETMDGVVFTNPPAGDPYKDEMLAYYAKF